MVRRKWFVPYLLTPSSPILYLLTMTYVACYIFTMGSGYISYSAAVILQALANGYIYGFDIMDATGLPSGTVYPSLRRLEQAELVISRWEEHSTAQRELRPPRKYYELTPDGDAARAEALTRYRLLERLSPATKRKIKPSRA